MGWLDIIGDKGAIVLERRQHLVGKKAHVEQAIVLRHTAVREIHHDMVSPGQRLQLRDLLEAIIGCSDDLNPDVKIGGLSFALKVLGYVENGHAIFDDNGLLLEGSVDTATVLDQVQQFVEKEKPEGVSVKGLRVSAPELSWRVQLDESDTIKISGIIPDDEKKSEVLSELRVHFPAHTIVDNSKFSDGLPEHWDESVSKSIEILAYLEYGLIDVTETAINVKGHAEDKAKLVLLLETTKEVPSSVAVNSEVTAPERTTGLEVIGGASTLSANVPGFTTNVE